MGFRDVLNGMMNGPGGQRQPSTGRNTKGVPRIIWALLGLLAYKAFRGDDGRAIPPKLAAKPESSGTPVAIRKRRSGAVAVVTKRFVSKASCVMFTYEMQEDDRRAKPFTCSSRRD